MLRNSFIEVHETLEDELFLSAAIRALICVAVNERAMRADKRGTASPLLLIVRDVA